MRTAIAAATIFAAVALPLLADEPRAPSPTPVPAGVKLLCSFEPEEMVRLLGKGARITASDDLLKARPPATPMAGVVVGKGDGWDMKLARDHATDGEYSVVKLSSGYGAYRPDDDRMTLMNPYVRLFGMDWVRSVIRFPDWRGYDYLWMDVTAPAAESIPYLFIEDSHTFGPYARFKVPQGRTVTLSLPLAAVVAWSKEHGEGDLDLADVRSIYCMDEACNGKPVFVDNLRLATKAAPKPANLVEPVEYIGADRGMLAEARKLPPLPRRDFPRRSGPVEPLGPVTLPQFDWGRSSPARGAFGEGGDYGTANVRAVAAYDNLRIAVVLGSDLVFATFDGGKTWGGFDGKGGKPSKMRSPSHGHGGEGAGFYNGDLYVLDRHMCNGGGGINRLDILPVLFQGDRWEDGPKVILDHHCRGCPGVYPILFQCPSGRVWAFWDAPRLRANDASPGVGCFARYSDDGGINWRSPGPHPNQLVAVVGERAAPYKDQVAVFGCGTAFDNAVFRWQSFDEKTQEFQDGPAIPDIGKFAVESVAGNSAGNLAAALLPRGGKRSGLTVATFVDGNWKSDRLDDGAAGPIGPVALTAGADKAGWIGCFWVRVEAGSGKTDHPLLYSIWTAKAAWSRPLEIARETDAVHRIVVPVVSPPDYAPVFWDKLSKGDWKQDYPWVRFARVPSDKPWKPEAAQSAD
jgi:hypothetical protein